MKLYIWNDPYGVAYGGSCLYAVAETEAQARELASVAGTSQYGHAPEGAGKRNHVKLGTPDRVHDLPHAEFYEWSE